MNKILIITHTADNESVTSVMQHIKALGGESIRFDVDRYPVGAQLTTQYSAGRWQLWLEDEHGSHSLDDISAVWYRRSYNIGKGLEKVLDKEFLSSSIGEVRRTLFGMLEGLPCFQLERYSVYRRLDSKEEQLRIAADCGLEIPATCITNSPEKLKAFMEATGKPIVAKMQSAFAIYREGREHVVFTSEINDSHLEQLQQLAYCPMTFQEKLPKALELRVTVVGRELFTFSIDSQQLPEAQTDWRKEGAALVEDWKPYTLPENISSGILKIMDLFGLNYGAIDLILTPEGKYYFLELNAAGEFFWLDKLCGYSISRHLAAVLLGQAERRE
ncbi:MvdC/MvdD family ATP grasp protein [Chitinophaga barathri]|uniref:MvdD family ATP-grasp ribosomal peptide maturase n=1 Tax=Chitinophaga barathri TaxID=1647451 RepID=A0A3N4M957_9BACT|nr:MvdD family ATP-grasp ribosomal peptide maturase [Chitinophaga barathri]RPD39835.1 MvdD family ATP-grasp ribosomal peptide maturase [Chitinophaga barathri]